MMDEFDALIHSLGEHAVTYLRRDLKLSQLSVFGDPVTGSAHVEIVLPHLAWEDQEAAIDRMLEIRDMFINEISIDFVIIDDNEQGELEPGHVREADFVAA